MNSGLPGSPCRRGPPRQAYQYVFGVPSANVTTDQLSFLSSMRMFGQPFLNFGVVEVAALHIGRLADFHLQLASADIDLDTRDVEAKGLHALDGASDFGF